MELRPWWGGTMMGPSSPGQPGVEPTHAHDEEPAGLARPEVLDWIDHIIPVAVGNAGRGSEAGAIEHPEAESAELAGLRARLEAVQGAGDLETERELLSRLARLLAARGHELSEAAQAASRALTLADDPELRAELALWLESLGDASGAAAVLQESVAAAPTAREASRLLVRVARLRMRAGETERAMEALSQAAAVWPGWGEPLELAGILAAVNRSDDAASLLLQAADRHEEAGERERASEIRRLAFSAVPASEMATAALVKMLDRAERPAAADEILRSHASSLDPAARERTHVQRLERAMARKDPAAALAAVIDGGLEATVEGPVGQMVGEALENAGLHDAVVIRLELAKRSLSGTARAAVIMAQARLFAGRLASPDRALEAWIEACDSDPENDEALQALRDHAATMRDPLPLAEALLRIVSSNAPEPRRIACARELQAIAEERLADPSLALWAVERILEISTQDAAAREAIERLRPRVRLQDGALQSARQTISSESGPARLEALRRAAAILRGRPGSGDEHLEVLSRLITESEDDRRWWIDLERLALRLGRVGRLENQLRARVERGVTRTEAPRIHTMLAMLAIRRGDLGTALEHSRALAREVAGLRSAHVMSWVLASATGNLVARSEAVEQSAPMLSARMRACAQAAAAGISLELGDTSAATRLAELAWRTDPSEPRVLALHADIALASGHADPRVLEKTCAVLLPRAGIVELLANELERAGDRRLAFAWTRRLFALIPWDAGVLDLLVVRATTSGAPDELAGVIDEILGSCMPARVLAIPLDKALRALAAFDPAQAATVALRVLSAIGPRHDGIRGLLLDMASGGKQPKLGATVIERWLATGATAEERPELLLRLARHYHEMGDADGEAYALERAAQTGADIAQLREMVNEALPAQTGDGLIARESARVRLAETSTPESRAEAARAWRTLGAAFWDLAGDRMRAVGAWAQAALLDEHAGAERLASDLEAFAGDQIAHDLLRMHAASLEDTSTAARLMVVAAAIALRHGRAESALETALRALELDSGRTDALVVIERAADGCHRPDAIDRAYWHAANGALGRAGRRAAHYRAARELYRRGVSDKAMAHAIQAFEADPINGPAFQLMVKLGAQSDPGEVVQSLQRAADAAPDPDKRAEWLRHGAELAASSPLHQRIALDMAFSALHASPDADVARLLGRILSTMMATMPEEREIIEVRLRRAVKGIAGKLEGPRGARVAIVLARQAIETLGSHALAYEWLEVALACSGDVDEYDALLEVAGSLAGEKQSAEAFLDQVLKRMSSFGGPVGASLLRLSSTMSYTLDDEPRSVAFSQAAQKMTSQDAADPFGDFGSDSDAPPATNEQADSWADLNEPEDKAETAGVQPEPWPEAPRSAEQPVQEPTLISAVPEESGTPAGAPAEPAFQEQTVPATIAEAVRMASEPPPAPPLPRDPVERAQALEARGDVEAAITVLEEAAGTEVEGARIELALRGLYERAGHHVRLIDLLDAMARRESTVARRVGLLSESATVCEIHRDLDGARARWLAVLELDRSHDEAFSWLDRDATTRLDHEMLAMLLGMRAGALTEPAAVRTLVARRAVSLEAIGCEPEALEEILATLERFGEDPALLRLAAQLADRGTDMVFAARLWSRLARITTDRPAAIAMACNAANTLLAHDLDGDARAAITPFLELGAADVLEVVVALERRTGSALTLGDALEALSDKTLDNPARRAQLLVEAADAALAAGDQAAAARRASQAASLVPEDAEIRFYSLTLQYRVEGLGNEQHARQFQASLQEISGRVAADDAPLHAFLSAEVQGALHGHEEALSILAQAHGVIGLKPLIALGMAEHLAALGSWDEALPLFEVALGSPELRGVRTISQVAFAAGRSAVRAGAFERAGAHLQVIERQAAAAELAANLREDLARAQAEPQPPPVWPEPMPEAAVAPTAPEAPPPPRAPQEDAAPSGAPASPHSVVFVAHPGRHDEERLYQELAAGSIEAGEALATLLSADPSRTRDLCAVRRRQVVIAPWDPRLVRLLRDAAIADRNRAHAEAVDHVLTVLEGGVPAAPEPILQHDQPERVVAMLLRGVHSVGAEAFHLLWTHAPNVLSRGASPYELESMEPVAFGTDSPVGRAWAQAARTLGLGRVNVYCHRSSGPIQTAAVATSPPSVVVTGQIEDSLELRYRMAFILAATMPANVMLFAVPEARIRGLMQAMIAAFGPPDASRGSESSTVQLAGALWHALPVRVQRRMAEILADPQSFRYEDLWPRALQSARRAGLFVVGDLRTALAEVAGDPGVKDVVDSSAPDAMMTLCKASGSAADLVRLATSAEYAEARWRGGWSSRTEGA